GRSDYQVLPDLDDRACRARSDQPARRAGRLRRPARRPGHLARPPQLFRLLSVCKRPLPRLAPLLLSDHARLDPAPRDIPGRAAGAVLECLQDLGVEAEGIDISAMAKARASERVRARIHHGDILTLDLPRQYDLLFGLDVFEHLNPNKLDAYLARLAAVTSDDALLFCNIPAFGADAVFGTVFPFYVDGWAEDAAAGKPLSRLHADEQ